VTVWTSPTSPN